MVSGLQQIAEDDCLSEVDQAWLALAEKRHAAYKAGERQGISGDRVFADLREDLGWPG